MRYARRLYLRRRAAAERASSRLERCEQRFLIWMRKTNVAFSRLFP